MLKLFYGLLMMIVCTTQGCISDNEPEGPSLKAGDSLPVFSVVMNDGSSVSTESLKGHVAVIVFFNTNCSDCRKELPVIQELWEIYKENQKVVIVPIAREESEAEIAEYWRANNLTMPYSPQDDRTIYSLFAPSVIPRIYVASPSGKITATFGDTDLPDVKTLISEIETADS